MQESVSPDHQQSAEPPAAAGVEGEDKKEIDDIANEEVGKEKGEEVKEEVEEEMVFDYDYEQMKSTPEMVNVTTSDMLTLLYPLIHIQTSFTILGQVNYYEYA